MGQINHKLEYKVSIDWYQDKKYYFASLEVNGYQYLGRYCRNWLGVLLFWWEVTRRFKDEQDS